jgi:uncharacterized protein DUF2330
MDAWLRRRWRASALAFLLALAVPPGARPCAPAPPAGKHVTIAGEDALIVWNPAARRQHFIRRARFVGDTADFGFLVPAPSRPELAEAPAEVFGRLTGAVQPRIVYRERYSICPSLLLCPVFMLRSVSDDARMTTAGVRVLEEKAVAGYDAAVLAADDPRALETWLRSRGYAQGPSLVEWLAPYVRDHWIVTAFKVAGGGTGPVGTAAVRMSFTTDRPLFPYREPADQREVPGPERLLRVFLVAPARMDGALADGTPWPGKLEFAAATVDLAPLLEGVVPAADIPRDGWLTAYGDESSPRPGHADLVFTASTDVRAVTPPPHEIDRPVVLPLPIAEGAVFAALGFWLWRRSQRRR